MQNPQVPSKTRVSCGGGSVKVIKLIVTLRQPVVFVHRSPFLVAIRHCSSDERNPADVTKIRTPMTNPASSAVPSRTRTMVYWGTTLVLVTECVVRGVMGALRLPPFIGVVGHLGYPAYLMTILGVWYVLAGAALLDPRFPRLKEWTYAGLIFNYTGAAASHLAVGDGAGALVAPLIFTGLTIASWALRPSARRNLAPSRAAHFEGGNSQ
jgi:uncharacterized membrane protein YphA (DoxX/SURF4 family)